MPHKHKRDKFKDDPSFYDLPPSRVANSLSAAKASATTIGPRSQVSKRKNARIKDDTPRAFARLLNGYRPPRSGLDDGNRTSKKPKSSKPKSEDDNSAPQVSLPTPTILPHEPLSSFSARVDAALPFSHLTKTTGGSKGVERERQTRMEKKMQKMQKEWREEERKRKEKLEAIMDNDSNEDGEDVWVEVNKQAQRKRRAGHNAGRESDDEDPWAHIRPKEGGNVPANEGKSGLVGLHDVVLEPPKFKRHSNQRENPGFAINAVGLKRREELTRARSSVIEGYRQMLKEKRDDVR